MMLRILLIIVFGAVGFLPALAQTTTLDTTLQAGSVACDGATTAVPPSLIWSGTAGGLVGTMTGSTYVVRNNQIVSFINDSFSQAGPCIDANSAPSLTGLVGQSPSINVVNRTLGGVGRTGCFRGQIFRPDGSFATSATLCPYTTKNNGTEIDSYWKLGCGDVSCGGLSFAKTGLIFPPRNSRSVVNKDSDAAVERTKGSDYLCVNPKGETFRSKCSCNAPC